MIAHAHCNGQWNSLGINDESMLSLKILYSSVAELSHVPVEIYQQVDIYDIYMYPVTLCAHIHINTDMIQSSRSTSSERFILPVMVDNINLFCCRSGRGNSIFLSNLPGLSNAGSNVSDRLVAMITCSHGNSIILQL